jgi:hypothetical protein
LKFQMAEIRAKQFCRKRFGGVKTLG